MVELVAPSLLGREDLYTNGLKVDQLEGRHVAETHPMPVLQKILTAATPEFHGHDNVFGVYCNINEYIAAPAEEVYRYAANVFSLEEWTYSIRNLYHVEDGLYGGTELLASNTQIWTKVETCREARTVDYQCAWDQSKELWMRYYMRFIDAEPCIGKPGTVLMWLNCKHPNYERGNPNAPQHIKASQARSDRPWVGDFWRLFKAGHDLEAGNLKAICEYRFGNMMK